ncbi:MAG: hypothetical protein AMXMBFR23_24250 [Chloroflexota bacterium]
MSGTDETPEPTPHEASRDAAASAGGALGRLVRRAREVASPGPERDRLVEQAREAIEAAKPQAERLARQAKAAADAARPHVERAAREAVQYTRDHQDDIRRVAGTGAIEFARRSVPPTLRPVADAVERELHTPRPPRAAHPSAADVPPATPDAGTETRDA